MLRATKVSGERLREFVERWGDNFSCGKATVWTHPNAPALPGHVRPDKLIRWLAKCPEREFIVVAGRLPSGAVDLQIRPEDN